MTEQEFKENKKKQLFKAYLDVMHARIDFIKASLDGLAIHMIPAIAQAEARVNNIKQHGYADHKRQATGIKVQPLKTNPFTRDDIKGMFKDVEGVAIL